MWRLVGIIAALSAAGSAFAQEASGPDTTSDEFYMISVTTRDCGDAVPKSGPGSRAEPIEAELAELSYIEDYDCTWVRSRATLRWTNYWHYRAFAYPNLMALYFGGYPSYRFVVDSFADPATGMSDLQHADVEFVALFADLCDRDFGEDVWVMGGPCHYGRAGLLQNVEITRIAAAPLRRLTGEANRTVIGSYARAPKEWRGAREARAAFLRWIDDARAGPERYHQHTWKPEDPEDEALAVAWRADPTTWENFISGSESPLRRLRRDSQRWTVGFFNAGPPDDEAGWNDVYSTDACVCLITDCADRWPLTPTDANRMWSEYVCAEVRRDDEDGWTVDY